MDIKTLSTETTLNIYSHITDTMRRQAAVNIDRKIGKTDAKMPIPTETSQPAEQQKMQSLNEITPNFGKIRKSGTGCLTMINDHLYEGRFTPTNAHGKRISCNVYATTREECVEKLAELIQTMKA